MTIKQVILTFFYFFSAFVYAQEKDVFEIARSGSLAEITSIFAKNPGEINSLNDKKSTPLLLACYRGNVDVALFLADNVKDVNYISGMGTALMAAVMSGNIKIIDKLIEVKANLDLSDAHERTALILATFFNKSEIVKNLIAAGADIRCTDKEGKTALDFAKFNKNTELIILLDH